MIEHEAKILDVNERELQERLMSIGAHKILDAVTYIEGYDFADETGGHKDSAEVPARFQAIAEKVRSLKGESSLFEQGAYLRLREEGEKTELIFKQKIEDSTSPDVKSEVEISVLIDRDEWDTVATLLENLGLSRIAVQEKKRVSYVYEPYRYDIDTWPGVPTYLEVEAPTHDDVLAAIALVGIARARATSLTAAEVFKLYGVQNPLRLLFSEVSS